MNTLNICAPHKKKYVTQNQIPFFKDLTKATIKRTRPQNKFLQRKTDWLNKLCTKQQNLCLALVKKSTKN